MWTIRKRILAKQPHAYVLLHSWREYREVPKIARLIADEDSPVVMAAHSWGVYFETLLAGELQRLDVPVNALVSADGVNKPTAQQLVVPSNVAEVYSWRGSGNVIVGKPLLIADATKTRLVIDRVVDLPHAAIDECKEFQDTVVRLATE